jgi:hypothetical protein
MTVVCLVLIYAIEKWINFYPIIQHERSLFYCFY